jgi:hypothetical protein
MYMYTMKHSVKYKLTGADINYTVISQTVELDGGLGGT